jgi:hypothetical protein
MGVQEKWTELNENIKLRGKTQDQKSTRTKIWWMVVSGMELLHGAFRVCWFQFLDCGLFGWMRVLKCTKDLNSEM